MTFFSLACCGRNLRQLTLAPESVESDWTDGETTQRSAAGECLWRLKGTSFHLVWLIEFDLPLDEAHLKQVWAQALHSERCRAFWNVHMCLHFCYLHLQLQILSNRRAAWEKTPLTKILNFGIKSYEKFSAHATVILYCQVGRWSRYMLWSFLHQKHQQCVWWFSTKEMSQ